MSRPFLQKFYAHLLADPVPAPVAAEAAQQAAHLTTTDLRRTASKETVLTGLQTIATLPECSACPAAGWAILDLLRQWRRTPSVGDALRNPNKATRPTKV